MASAEQGDCQPIQHLLSFHRINTWSSAIFMNESTERAPGAETAARDVWHPHLLMTTSPAAYAMQ